jgi:glycosyltransferase involved in cell wall biosynthesis
MKISVLIPAYNHGRYLAAAVQSVLDQSFQDFELVVVDDGSTDNSRDVIRSFTDPRIRFFQQENRGAHAAINRAVELSGGQYVSILNSDDLYHPRRLESCLAVLEQNPGTGAVISRVSGIDDEGRPVGRKTSAQVRAWLDWYQEALPLFQGNRFFPAVFAKNLLITTSNYFLRRSVLEQTGPFRPLRYAHDWDLLIRLAAVSRIHLLDQELLCYRMHTANTVHEPQSEKRVRFEVNWLIAQNLGQCFGKEAGLGEIMGLLAGNHYVSLPVLLYILAWSRHDTSEELLDFAHPVTGRIIAELL